MPKKKRILRVENGRVYEYASKRGQRTRGPAGRTRLPRGHNRRRVKVCFVEMADRVQCAEKAGRTGTKFLPQDICEQVGWGRLADCSSGGMYHAGRGGGGGGVEEWAATMEEFDSPYDVRYPGAILGY